METMNYKRFCMKWTNKCTECGKRLEVGTYAYGQKGDYANKWRFICPSCHDHSGDPNLKKEVMPKSDGELAEYLNLMGDEVSSGSPTMDEPAKTLKSAMAPSILDLIKENAQYGGM